MRNVHSAVAARAGGAASGARSAAAARTRTAPMERDRMDGDDETRVISMWRRGFRGPQQLRSRQKRVQRDPDLSEGLLAALLAVHDRDDVGYLRPVAAGPLDRLHQGPARRHDVLDEEQVVAAIEGALEVQGGAVLLALLPDHDVRL